MYTNRKGFTLIELLIVVVIIGILAAVAIPKFAATKDKAMLANIKSDLANIRTAEEAYFSDHMAYAPPAALPVEMFSPTLPNVVSGSVSGAGYTATVTNSNISGSVKSCSLTLGSGTSTDGVISCP